jgi:hypothetical protein
MYLATGTRPDIAHAVGLSRFVSTSRVQHWAAAKSVLRCLAGTTELGLLYGDQTQQFKCEPQHLFVLCRSAASTVCTEADCTATETRNTRNDRSEQHACPAMQHAFA